tara:strand:- start:3168 stop:4343 length:1176 start_codon:yes stop_codon:yes gene_type:complete
MADLTIKENLLSDGPLGTETNTSAAIDQTSKPFLSKRRRWVRLIIVFFFSVIGPAAIGVGGLFLYATGGRFVSTENAHIKADKIAISADISGRVSVVNVREHQLVTKGTLLFKLDPEPFRIALAQSDAHVAAARQNIVALKARYLQTVAERREVEGDVIFFKRRVERQRKLHGKGFVSQSKLDDAEQTLRAAKDRFSAISQSLASVRARLAGNININSDAHPQVRAALSIRDSKALNLRRTEVYAPTDGVITNFGLETGEYIEEGEPIFSLVRTGAFWVTANYKETDLTYVRVGQRATLKVDAYPDVQYNARVTSIAPATGSEFALLPPQNASGNWVKVVQRLPVLLELSNTYGGPPLRAGMSVAVEVDTKHKRKVPSFLSEAISWLSPRY